MASDNESNLLIPKDVSRSRRRRTISTRSLQTVVTDLERFHRRTISTSDMRRSRSGYLSLEENEEPEMEIRSNTISNIETVIHLVKGNIGIGVLTMPIAMSCAGLVGGVLGMVFVALVTIHCMHLLVSSAQKLVREKNVNFLDYADTAEAAFVSAGGTWARYSVFMRRLINIFLCMSQIGSNAVYILFVAQNILPIVEAHLAPGWNYRIYIGLLILPVILVCSIKNLKYLSPCSVLANILEFVGLGIIFYYIFETKLPATNTVPWFAGPEMFPIFFGTAIFAFEGISVVLPIENQMRKPQDMLGFAGVLNFSMVAIALLYIFMGFFGYLRYGDHIMSSITLNLPESPLAEIALLMFSVAIFFSYALQFYVVMDIIGPNILKPLVSDTTYPYAEFLTRVFLNLFTLGLTATVPWLELLVSLLGAVKMSTLSLMAPAIIDTAAHWNSDDTKMHFIYRSVKNIAIFAIGFLACVIGTYISTLEIVKKFQHGY